MDGRKFPVKQALSAATGEDRRNFISTQAVDWLSKLGFRVTRQEHTLADLTDDADLAEDAEQPPDRETAVRLAILKAAIRYADRCPDRTVATVLEAARAFEAWVFAV